MSRTEGIHLPRLPTSHARAVSSHAIQLLNSRQEPLSEPNYTAFVGTPRQDIPHQIYHSATMFDDVFERQGRLFTGRNTPKATNPLNSLQYNSLHDPHCKRLFLNNQALRDHLIQLGLLTDDLRVISSTKEQRQKIRAHEILERKEQLYEKLNQKEKRRIQNMPQSLKLPQRYQTSLQRAEEKRLAWEDVQRRKVETALQEREALRKKEMGKKKERKEKLKNLLDQIELEEQTRCNAARLQQLETERIVYEERYGKTATWHRASDSIHNRMVLLSKTKWAKPKQKKQITLAPPTLELSFSQQTSLISQDKEPKNEPQELTREEKQQREEEDNKEEKQKTEDERKTEKERVVVKKQETKKQEVLEDGKHQISGAIQVQAEPLNDIPALPQPTILQSTAAETQQSTLLQFFVELLMMGSNGNGYISFDDLHQILSSNDLDLPVDHEELLILTGNVYGLAAVGNTGMISIDQAAAVLPQQVVNIFAERMQSQLGQYGMLAEELWLQISPTTNGYLYMNKMTGQVQTERPQDYRTFLKEDPFEDIIIGLFQTADANRDGFIDDTDFQMFLSSPYMNERIYTEQIEELHYYYLDLATEGALVLQQFVPLAHIILQMIYNLAHPDKEWIEVDLKKGRFLYNPTTGQARAHETIKKPPPLRRRQHSTNLLGIDLQQEEVLDNEKETRKLVEEVAEKLQSGVRIIDTIPEEEEEEEEIKEGKPDPDVSDQQLKTDLDEVLQNVLEERDHDKQ